MRVLLTGAAGFIGSHVAERLLARGDEVIGVDNFDPFYAASLKRSNLRRATASDGFRLLEADVAELDRLGEALGNESVEAVVHLAAKAGVRPSIEDPRGYTRANVVATQAVLSAAWAHGVRRLVFGSSSSVYGDRAPVPFTEDDPAVDPVSPYAATKRAGELLCRTHQALHGGSILCLRLFTVYGPRQRPDLAIRKFGSLLLRGQPIPLFGDGTSQRDYTWIDDIVDGILAALDRGAAVPDEFQVINLGGNRTTELHRLVELLSRALDVEPEIERLPFQPGDVRRTWADLTRARELLGYEPRVGIEEGLERFARWLRASQQSLVPGSSEHGS